MYAQCVKKFIDSYKHNSFSVENLRFKIVQEIAAERHFLLCLDKRSADAHMVNSVHVCGSPFYDFDGFYRRFPEDKKATLLAEKVLVEVSNVYGVRFNLHNVTTKNYFDFALVESGVAQVALCYDLSRHRVDLFV